MFSVYIKQKVCVDSYVWDEFDTHRCFLVNRFYDKLLVIERDVSDLTPGEANLWRQPEKKKKLCPKVVKNLHFQHFLCPTHTMIYSTRCSQLVCRMFCNIQSADGATYKHTTFPKIRKLNTPFKFTFESLLSFISVKNSDRKGKEVDETQITSCLEIQEWWVYSRTHK